MQVVCGGSRRGVKATCEVERRVSISQFHASLSKGCPSAQLPITLTSSCRLHNESTRTSVALEAYELKLTKPTSDLAGVDSVEQTVNCGLCEDDMMGRGPHSSPHSCCRLFRPRCRPQPSGHLGQHRLPPSIPGSGGWHDGWRRRGGPLLRRRGGGRRRGHHERHLPAHPPGAGDACVLRQRQG